MKSMKMSKKEMTKMEPTVAEDKAEYPYGLRLNLDHETMKKLGMMSMPEMGKAMILHARVEVTDMHESASQGDKEPYRSMTLQITDMELEAEPEKKSTAELLYDKE